MAARACKNLAIHRKGAFTLLHISAKLDATEGMNMNAFFSGKVRDKTTKESRKAADCLSSLKTIKKNPLWMPSDSKTKMLKQSSKNGGLPSSELAKIHAQIGDTMPVEVLANTTKQIAEFTSSDQPSAGGSSMTGNYAFKNPMLCDVEAEIHRRIQALGKSGKMFEDNAAYLHDQQLAADAPLIIQGIDPQAAWSQEKYVRGRRITPLRKHWMASKTGFYTTPYGKVYVHTDGSVALFSSSSAEDSQKCKCGMVHIM